MTSLKVKSTAASTRNVEDVTEMPSPSIHLGQKVRTQIKLLVLVWQECEFSMDFVVPNQGRLY